MGKRAPRLQANTSTVEDAVSNGFSGMEELKEELQGWYDNLPEAFQNGQKGEQLQTAIDAIDQHSEPDVSDRMKELLKGIEAQYHTQTKKRQTRADRRDDFVGMLRAAHEAIGDHVETLRNQETSKSPAEAVSEDDISDLETLSGDIQQAIDEFEAVEFPGWRS